MSEQPPSGQPPVEPGASQPADWRSQRREWRDQLREERREWREERREFRTQGAWIMGLALVALGVIFLLQNMGLLELRNWWALFIMIPALGAFSEAWGRYRSAGNRLTGAARGSLLGGLFFTLLTAIFLFGWNSGLIWPVVIILVGLGVLLNALLPG